MNLIGSLSCNIIYIAATLIAIDAIANADINPNAKFFILVPM